MLIVLSSMSHALLFCAQGDIIMSLQSRLDIICDEADADSGSNHDVDKETSDEISTEKPVAQFVLQSLRSGLHY